MSPPRHLRCLRCLHRCYCPGFLLLPGDWTFLFAWLVFVQRVEGHAGRKEEREESEEMIWLYLTCSVAHTASSPKCLHHLSCFVCLGCTCKYKENDYFYNHTFYNVYLLIGIYGLWLFFLIKELPALELAVLNLMIKVFIQTKSTIRQHLIERGTLGLLVCLKEDPGKRKLFRM